MKRKQRVSVWLSEDEKHELTMRAKRANMKMRRFLREFLMRRVRSRLDTAIFDELHRMRIDLHKHGGLLAQMRNRLLEQRISRDMKNDVSDIIRQHAEACTAVHELKSLLEAKLNRDDESEVADNDHKENLAH